MTNPVTSSPQETSPAQPDGCIVKAAIYPPIGICRVGNSPDEFYIGPEVPEPPALRPGSYRDSQGRLKRQAARFRVYGLNARNEPVKELTAADAEIIWAVTLANQKRPGMSSSLPSIFQKLPMRFLLFYEIQP